MISEENCIYYENTEYVVFPLNTIEHWLNFKKLLQNCTYEDAVQYYNQYLVSANIEEQDKYCILLMNECRTILYQKLYHYVDEVIEGDNTLFEEVHLPVRNDFASQEMTPVGD